MSKIQRYQRKDYNQCIEFPVEIVGRDGVIRQYSFEQSILLYQQRMSSARQRYVSSDIIDAEIEHCSKRIAQLRRSYFIRYGWESFRFVDSPPNFLSMEIAGEIAAFLRTNFGCGVRQANAKLRCLSENKLDMIFSVSIEKESNVFLLYTHGNGKKYREFLSLHQFQEGEHVDKILLTHDGRNIWLTLTGKSLDYVEVESNEQEVNTVLSDALNAVKQGRLTEGLARFFIAFEQNPYCRGAYWGAAIVAEKVHAYADAELALQMGTRYFPDDPGLLIRLAATQLRRADGNAAAISLQKAIEKGGASELTNYLGVIVELVQGKIFGKLNKLRVLQPQLLNYPGVYNGCSWITSQLRARGLIRFFALTLAILSSYCALIGWQWMWGFMLVSISIVPLAHRSWHRQFLLCLKGKTHREVPLLPSTDLQQINHLQRASQ